MRKVALFLLFITSACSAETAKEIPQGTWQYRISMNGHHVGTATVTTVYKEGNWISSMNMETGAGFIGNNSWQETVEDASFRPLSITSRSEIIRGKEIDTSESNTLFHDGSASLRSGEYSSTVALPDSIRLDGVYLLNELIQAGFTEGTRVNTLIYEPSIDPAEPVTVKIHVVDIKKITVNGRKYRTAVVHETVGTAKAIESYIDIATGVTLLVEMSMLNNHLKMELIDK